jgi:GDP-L-fucose synthase
MSYALSKDDKIYVAGHRGLLGPALIRHLQDGGYHNLLYRTHDELNLTRQREVDAFFAANKPECVILNAAAPANSVNVRTKPLSLMWDNTMINMNVIHACLTNDVKKLLYMCSGAAYPSDAETILTPEGAKLLEDAMKPGAIEKETERYYVMPKLLGEEMCRAINKAGAMQCVTVVPIHIYGEEYHYEEPDRLSVFPALIKRFSDATKAGLRQVVVWGTGNLRREMTFVDDVAEACLCLMEAEDVTGIYNVGSGKYVSVREMAEAIKHISRFNGEIVFDATKPEAAEFSLLCTDKIEKLGWKPKIEFHEGARLAYSYYIKHFV